jgi:hypothetical protein
LRRNAVIGREDNCELIVLRSGETATARLPTIEERLLLRLGEWVPVWEITDVLGGTRLHTTENTVLIPSPGSAN